jgi:ATP-dependent DNA helicase RecG
MGIIEHIGRTKFVLARGIYKAVGKPGVHTRLVGLDRDMNKELIFEHLKKSGTEGAPLKELQQVLPSYSWSQIQVLLRELRKEKRVFVEGKTSAAKWFVVTN